MAGVLGRFFWLFARSYRRRALKNLDWSGWPEGEALRIAKASFRSNILVLFESMAMGRLIERSGIRVETRVSPAAEILLAEVRSGRHQTVLGVSGHLGVWELLGAELARLSAPTPFIVSANLVDSPVLARYLVRLRGGYNVKLIERERFLRFFFEQLRSETPNVYAILNDTHSSDGYKVPFMGRASCTRGIVARLAYKYGAPVILGRSRRRAPGDYLVELDVLDMAQFAGRSEEVVERDIMAAITRFIEESIKIAPEQWIWGHKRWKICCGERVLKKSDGDEPGREERHPQGDDAGSAMPGPRSRSTAVGR
jgi:KDO2-lipid IV(A) lauroyltransferase